MTQYRTTPTLDALLGRLSRALRRNLWLYGLGTALAGAAVWLLFMYGADRLLKLPGPIRLFHTIVLVAGTGWLLRRALFARAKALPSKSGLAMMAQEALPEDVPRDDRFVAALQLRESVDPAHPSAPLVQQLLDDAETAAPRAQLSRVIDGRAPRRRVAMAAAATLVTAGVLGAQPAMARIFAARMLGGDTSWPRDTTLSLEIPGATAAVSVDDSDPEVIRVRAARGTDVPILVRAAGVIPDFVTVRFEESGQSVEVGESGPASFSTILPSIQEATTLTVVGGDDRRGVPRVEIEVLQPPDLADLVFEVRPPAYSGLPERTLRGEATARVLEGSTVTVSILPDPLDATGIARTFPAGDAIELASAPFPAATSADGLAPESAGDAPPSPTGLRFEHVATDSLRFRVELTDGSGLTNPDPALFGIEAYPDRAPELVVLSPAKVELPVVLGSAIPVRLIARDDFDVASLALEVRDPRSGDVLETLALETTDAEPTVGRGGRADDAVAALRLTELTELAAQGLSAQGTAPLAEGSTLDLVAVARDGRAPEPNQVSSSPISVRVVSLDEFLRRQRDALRVAAEDVVRIKDRVERAEIDFELLLATVSGDSAELPSPGRIAAALGDARRAEGDLSSLARDLAAIAAGMIHSRIDERAGPLETRLMELHALSPAERGFPAATWRTLSSELAAGQLGAPGRAAALVRVTGMATEASATGARRVIDELTAARAAADVASARTSLAAAARAMADLRDTITVLAGELGEWDSMQSIQARTRDILNSSKNLEARLKKQAEKK